MLDFLFEMRLPRVVFGLNTMTRLKAEIEKLGCGAALVLATPRAARIFAGETCGRELPLVGTYENAQMHTPVEVTERALAFLASVKADGLISFGGGSAIGLGKALALRTRLPHLAIPTTYSGSEMTSVVGETSEGRKRTTNDASILPKTVIYDVSQTFALPAPASVTSAMNAIAHGVEAMYAENGSPIRFSNRRDWGSIARLRRTGFVRIQMIMRAGHGRSTVRGCAGCA